MNKKAVFLSEENVRAFYSGNQSFGQIDIFVHTFNYPDARLLQWRKCIWTVSEDDGNCVTASSMAGYEGNPI